MKSAQPTRRVPHASIRALLSATLGLVTQSCPLQRAAERICAFSAQCSPACQGGCSESMSGGLLCRATRGLGTRMRA